MRMRLVLIQTRTTTEGLYTTRLGCPFLALRGGLAV